MPASCRRGPLVSIEGINGVGKTYLTQRLLATLRNADIVEPLLLEEFSTRAADKPTDLGRALLTALIDAVDGDMFLRGGTPGAETLLLLAIKIHDLDLAAPALASGRAVIEGRGLDTTAVYQSLITHPDDADARSAARDLLNLAAGWRALPDLTILVTDHAEAAISRAERRIGTPYSPEDRLLQRRAARLYETLAADSPGRVRILDRRTLTAEQAVVQMRAWLSELSHASLGCLSEPWRGVGRTVCAERCRLSRLNEPHAAASTAP